MTGASSGIGRQAAIQASRLGAKLFITGRDEGKLADTYNSMEGADHGMFPVDLTDEGQMLELVKYVPKVNGIVHGAGIIGPTPAKFIRQDDINKLLRINFEVPVLLTAKLLVLKKLQNGASIVFLSTIATKSPYFGGALYASAKAALEAYSSTLALELAPKKIRSNILSPSLVETPLLTETIRESNKEIVDDSLQRYLHKYPMGIGTPEDVANLIAFLLAEESKWISGANIPLGAVVQ